MSHFTHPKRRYLKRYLVFLAILTVVASLMVSANIISIGRRGSITADGGVTYYVSPSGNDTNNGSLTAPFATPAKATAVARGGDTIKLADGAYTQSATLKFASSGTAVAPIILKAEHRGKAAIIGPATAGLYGIYIDKNYIIIDGIEQKDAGESGIKPSGTNISIINSSVHGNGVPYFGGPHLHNGQGIGASSPSAQFLKIENNDIYGNFEHGIYISGSDDTSIIGNKIHDNGYFDLQFNDDGGIDGSMRGYVANNMIYSTTHPQESGGMNLVTLRSSIVQNNVVYEAGKGITLSGTNGKNNYIPADNNLFKFNTFVSSGYGTVTVTKAEAVGNKFYNNIIVHTASNLSGQSPYVFDAGGLGESDHNVVWNAGGTNIGQLPDGVKYNFGQWQQNTHLDAHAKNLDPHFVNLGDNDYRLNSDSPAIGLATSAFTVDTDIDGNGRPSGGTYDAGAYEYQSSSTAKPKADLLLTKIVDQPSPHEGDIVNFTVTLKNNGPDVAKNVVVHDAVPSGISFVSSTLTGGQYDSATGNWSLGALNAHLVVTLILKGRVNIGTANKTITNTANAKQDSSIIDDPANNGASASLTIAEPAKSTDTSKTGSGSGGSTDSTKSQDLAPAGSGQGDRLAPINNTSTTPPVSGPVTSSNSANAGSATQAKPVPRALLDARIDTTKSYVKVDGNHVVADGKSAFKIVVGIKDNNGAFITNMMPKALFSQADITKGDTVLIGNEWFIGVRATKPGTYLAKVTVGDVSLADASLSFLSQVEVGATKSVDAAQSFVTPPSPDNTTIAAPIISVARWDLTKISLHNFFIRIKDTLVRWLGAQS